MARKKKINEEDFFNEVDLNNIYFREVTLETTPIEDIPEHIGEYAFGILLAQSDYIDEELEYMEEYFVEEEEYKFAIITRNERDSRNGFHRYITFDYELDIYLKEIIKKYKLYSF